MNEALEKLTQQFRADFPKKAADIERLREELSQAHSEDSQTLKDLHDKIHFMKGAFGIYGFTSLFDHCDGIQQSIENGHDMEKLDQRLRLMISDLTKQAL